MVNPTPASTSSLPPIFITRFRIWPFPPRRTATPAFVSTPTLPSNPPPTPLPILGPTRFDALCYCINGIVPCRLPAHSSETDNSIVGTCGHRVNHECIHRWLREQDVDTRCLRLPCGCLMVHFGTEGDTYKKVLEKLNYSVRLDGGFVIAGPPLINRWWESEYAAGDGGWL